MDGLRLSLLVIGALIVVLVYWQSRRRQSAELRHSRPSVRVEPGLHPEATSEPLAAADEDDLPRMTARPALRPAADIDDDVGVSPVAADDDDVDRDDEAEESAADKVPEKVISLRIVPKMGREFSLEEVVLTLRGVGLTHGRFSIFHRLHDNDEALFSVASLTEPGSFDLQNLRDQTLAGLSFFMLRPGPGRGVDAFDKMVEVARAVATSIQGELLDGDGSTLSIQRERFLREDLIQYELKHLQLQ